MYAARGTDSKSHKKYAFGHSEVRKRVSVRGWVRFTTRGVMGSGGYMTKISTKWPIFVFS